MSLVTVPVMRRKVGFSLAQQVAALFAAGEQGIWLDPSDFSTMFQDSAGTTPVTAVEQPVGLILDKSKGLVLGSELVTNGGFDSDTWWLKGPGCTITGGVGVVSAAVAGSGFYRTDLMVVGKYYEVTFTIVSISAGGIKNKLGTSTAGTTRSTAGTYTERLLCEGSAYYTLDTVGASTTCTVDNISVKELSGNHASQATATSRPVVSARYNLLTKTEQFDNAAWTKTNVSVTANSIANASGSVIADTITGTGTAVVQHIRSSVSLPIGTYTFRVRAKKGASNYIQFYMNAAVVGTNSSVNFDLDLGVLGTKTGNWTNEAITSLGDGWYLCEAQITFNIASSPIYMLLVSSASAANFATSTGGSVYFDRAEAVYTQQKTLAYQTVDTATDYDADLTKFKPYLKFDGVDDSLATAAINFTATDKMTVWAGVRKAADTICAVAELSADVSANNGAFMLWHSNVAAYYVFSNKGTVLSSANGSIQTAPITNVITGLADISGDTASIRVNGVEIANNTGDQGTGNYGNFALFIGRRNGATLPFNGNLHSLIIRGAASTAAEITSGEDYVAGKTGITL